MPDKLSPVLQKYVEHMARCNRPMEFPEIVSVTPRYNGFHRLRVSGAIRDISRKYIFPEEQFTGPRTAWYILTEKGMALAGKDFIPETRPVCCRCHNPLAVDFQVPDSIWQVAVPAKYRESVHCLTCFDVLATLQQIDWAGTVTLTPLPGYRRAG